MNNIPRSVLGPLGRVCTGELAALWSLTRSASSLSAVAASTTKSGSSSLQAEVRTTTPPKPFLTSQMEEQRCECSADNLFD